MRAQWCIAIRVFVRENTQALTTSPDTKHIHTHTQDTIIDYSMIVVLDMGQVVEYGTPHELLQIQGGHFVGLIEELGVEAAASMREIALQVSSDATEWGVNATEKDRRTEAVRMA